MANFTQVGRALLNAIGIQTPGQMEESWNRQVQATLDLISHLNTGGTLGMEGEEEFVDRMKREGGDWKVWAEGVSNGRKEQGR